MTLITILLLGLSSIKPFADCVFLLDNIFSESVKTNINRPLLKPSPSSEQYFDQTLDHFNDNDPRYWDQVCRKMLLEIYLFQLSFRHRRALNSLDKKYTF